MEAFLGFLMVVGLVVYIRNHKKSKPTINKENKLNVATVELKNINKNAVSNLFVGQIVTIDVDAPEDEDGIIDDEKVRYNLITYPKNTRIGSLKSEDEGLGEKYQYAILKEISNEKIVACIICENVMINRFKLNPAKSIPNGELLGITKEGNKYVAKYGNEVLGEIHDERLTDELMKKICYFAYDNGCAQAIIKE